MALAGRCEGMEGRRVTMLARMLWWAKHHALNVAHITQSDAAARVGIALAMARHDALAANWRAHQDSNLEPFA